MWAAHALRRLALGRRATAAAAGAAGVTFGLMASDPHSPLLCDGASLLQQRESATPLLFCWGRLVPSSGQEDSPVRMIERSPVDTDFFSSQGLRVAQMSYGGRHAAVLDSVGGLWVWGEQAGPLPVRLPCKAEISCLASSESTLYAVTKSGRVLEWRDLDTALATGGGPPAEPKPLGGAMGKVHAIGVAAGDAHVLMIGRGGEVVAMGDNSRGQLGVGDPMKIPKCEMPNLLEKLPSPAVRAACGGAHSLVLMENGECVSFGDDRNLQLGLRNRTNLKALRDEARTIVATPQVVSCFAGKRIRQVAAGGGGVEGGHSVFLVDGEEGDELWACGYGRWGQLGGRAYTHVTEPARLTALGKLRE